MLNIAGGILSFLLSTSSGVVWWAKSPSEVIQSANFNAPQRMMDARRQSLEMQQLEIELRNRQEQLRINSAVNYVIRESIDSLFDYKKCMRLALQTNYPAEVISACSYQRLNLPASVQRIVEE